MVKRSGDVGDIADDDKRNETVDTVKKDEGCWRRKGGDVKMIARVTEIGDWGFGMQRVELERRV